jgi:hypothetical protein
MEVSKRLQDELDVAKQLRDELNLQLHLGAAEAKDVFEATEHKLAEVEGMVRRIFHEAEQPLYEMNDSAHRLLHEIREGYCRVRELL